MEKQTKYLLTLYVSECIKICLGADEEGFESLWVRIKG